MYKNGLRSIILCICILAIACVGISATAFAEDTVGEVVLVNSDFNAVRGQTFTTTISVKEGSNLTGIQVTLKYNSDYVTLDNYERLSASEIKVEGDQITVVYANSVNVAENIDLVELTFVIDEYLVEGVYGDWLVWTNNEDDEAFTTDGYVGLKPNYVALSISEDFGDLFIRGVGDVYNNKFDGKINARDASYVLQHVARIATIPQDQLIYANAYEDYNKDGTPKINARDASMILQYVARIKPTLSNRVNITFNALSDDGSHVKHVAKSVVIGSSLTKIPEVPTMSGKTNGRWSLSKTEYVAPDFEEVNEAFAVYAIYDDIVIEDFTITYNLGKFGVNSENNPETYTIEDEITLSDPHMGDYIFQGWFDENGEQVKKIEKGSTGDITLTPKWRSQRYAFVSVDDMESANMDIPYEKEMSFQGIQEKLPSVKDGEYSDEGVTVNNDVHVFMYYLGYIDKVPVSNASPVEHNGYNTVNWTSKYSSDQSGTYTKESTSVTEVIDKWKQTTTLGTEIGASLSVAGLGSITAKVTTELKLEVEHEEKTTEETRIFESKSYSIQEVTEQTLKIEDYKDKGFYRFINFATVDVMAIVVYNSANHEYELATVNILRNTYTGWDYAITSDFSDNYYADDSFDFEIPDEVVNFINGTREWTDGLVFELNSDGAGYTVSAYGGDATDVVIPSYYVPKDENGNIIKGEKGLPVTGIKAGTNANNGVFANKNIESVKLGMSIKDIPSYTFYNCSNLKTVELAPDYDGQAKDRTLTIGDKAFYGCSALEFDLFDKVESYGDYAFSGCELIDSVEIRDGVSEFGASVFENCGDLALTVNLTSDMLAGYVSSGASEVYATVGEGASISNLIIPEKVEIFELVGGKNTFDGISITSYADIVKLKDITFTSAKLIDIYGSELTMDGVTITSSGDVIKFNNDVTLKIRGNMTWTAGNSSSAKGGTVITALGNLDVTPLNSNEIVNFTLKAGSGAPGGEGMSVAGNLNVSGYINLTVTAGNGVNGGNGSTGDKYGGDGGSGKVGGDAIVATSASINLKQNSILRITGGDGGNGGYGGYANSDYCQGYGGRGGDGGNGGYAINASNITVVCDDAKLQGGKGGNGNTGGEGEDWGTAAGHGGNGGNGGNAGNAIPLDSVNTFEGYLIYIIGGKAGSGGSGGKGQSSWFNDGINGSAGSAGARLSIAVDYREGDKRYVFYDDEATWDVAKAKAEEAGGYLATITSAEEHDIIKELFAYGSRDKYFLGGHRSETNSSVWVWVTGEAFNYAPWNSGEPNNSGNVEDKAEITSTFNFNDASGNYTGRGYIVEFDY